MEPVGAWKDNHWVPMAAYRTPPYPDGNTIFGIESLEPICRYLSVHQVECVGGRLPDRLAHGMQGLAENIFRR